MFKLLLEFYKERYNWKDVIDVYNYYYKDREFLNYYFVRKGENLYCGATIQYSKYFDNYRIKYYGYKANEHETLVSHANKLLCNIDTKNVKCSDVLNFIKKAKTNENYEALEKIKNELK